MLTIAASFLVLTLLSVFVQTFMVYRWVRDLRIASDQTTVDFCPPASIILCLRGADPSLRPCLEALLGQEYGDYQVICVVDPDDVAGAEFVRERVGETRGSLQLVISEAPSGHCGLKNQSLLSGLQRVRENDEAIALVDADCVVDPRWLADLVAPLTNPNVGLVLGNRWFFPVDSRLGTIARWLWQMAAAPQMHLYRIPWGGSLVIRRDLVQAGDLAGTWRRALFDDTFLTAVAEQAGYAVTPAPSVLVPSHESTSLGGLFRWLPRQLLNMRLYHPAWPRVVLHCLTLNGLLWGSLVLMAVGGVSGAWPAVFCAMAAVGISLLFFVVMLWWIDGAANRCMARRYAWPACPRPGMARLLMGGVAVQLAYVLGVLKARWTRLVRWRGVTYRVDGPYRVTIMENDTSTLAASHPGAGDSTDTTSVEF